MIDSSWKTHKLFTDDRTSNLDAYLEGASDFQEKAIKEIESYRDGFIKNSTTYQRLDIVINKIKNLKA